VRGQASQLLQQVMVCTTSRHQAVLAKVPATSCSKLSALKQVLKACLWVRQGQLVRRQWLQVTAKL
jgi:hypothetical protein